MSSLAALLLVGVVGSGVAQATLSSFSSDNSAVFPEKAIALVYDDGPDANSLAVAQYLHDQRVPATFNVVGDWGGLGTTGFTISRYVNYLPSVVQLGHRLGNHTYNHAVLTQVDADNVRWQIRQASEYITQNVTNKFFPFTAPGGNWNQATTDAALADSALSKLSGPYDQWYIPGVPARCHYRLPAPSTECQSPNANDWAYLQAGFTPQQYVDDLLAAIDAQPHPHGNLYLHDRNASGVGGTYALDVTRLLIPALKARGFVFVGLSMKSSAPTSFQRFPESVWASAAPYAGTFRAGDINGDGLTDVCARGPSGISCSVASIVPSSGLGSTPAIVYGPAQLWEGTEFSDANGWTDYPHAATIMLGDVTGDGKADIVAKNIAGLVVGQSTGSSFRAPTIWSHLGSSGHYDFADVDGWVADASYYRSFRVGDISGDGKADVCARGSAGIYCATSNGSSFNAASYRLTSDFTDALGWKDVRYATTMTLADVDGNGKVDVVAKGGAGLMVALANSSGSAFAGPVLWSAPAGSNYDFGDWEGFWQRSESYWGTFRAGDLNGDGRADVCVRAVTGARCALSTGSGFLQSIVWDDQFTDGNGWSSVNAALTLMIGDADGDGRADLLARNSSGLIADYAP